MAGSKYKHYPKRPNKLTAEFAKSEYKKLLERLPAAEASEKPNLWIKLFADWNALKSYTGSEFARTEYAFHKKMNDKQLVTKEKYFREKISPLIDKPEHRLATALVSSRHRQAIADRYGKHLPIIYDIWLRSFNPVNTKLYVKSSRLTNRYSKLLGAAKLKVRGQPVTINVARSFMFDADSKLRREGFIATGDWVLKNKSRMGSIFGELVVIRNEIAKNVGYKDYVDYAYDSRGREGYGEAEVAKFRQYVKKYFVPLRKQIDAATAKSLNQKSIRPWDGYMPNYSLPRGSVPISKQLAASERLFQKLSPYLARHFKTMRREKLIDLESRPHKFSNAYCTAFPDQNKVAILLNSTGDPDDVRVMVHEMGHAFQAAESMSSIKAVELQGGTAELAEVYSMGMEFLSLPYLDEFFKPEDVKKSVSYKWIESISTLCYVCMVDEFQHWVYRHINATPAQRDAMWMKLAKQYSPSVDYSGIEKYRSTRWYFQQHIFNWPFYYIDYALAEICAMQLGATIKTKHRQTINEYIKLCKLGGTMSFIDTVKAAGLKSPFKESTIASLAKHTKKELGL